MDPFEKEFNPNPNLTEVHGEDLLAIDVNSKVSHNPCENPNVSEVSASTVLVDVVSQKPCSDDRMKVFLHIRPLLVPFPHKTTVHPKIRLAQVEGWKRGDGQPGEEDEKELHSSMRFSFRHHHAALHAKSDEIRSLQRVSQVFSSDSSQEEVYAKAVSPLVEDFLGGKSGLLAASGPSGSGKTHTMFGSARELGLFDECSIQLLVVKTAQRGRLVTFIDTHEYEEHLFSHILCISLIPIIFLRVSNRLLLVVGPIHLELWSSSQAPRTSREACIDQDVRSGKMLQ